MKIKQFRYSADNLAYLVYGTKTAVAIDAGAVSEMIVFAKETGVTISHVTNTHMHYDHTTGNDAMLEQTGAEFIDCRSFIPQGTIDIDGEVLEVFHTPGHMDECVTFKAANWMITGDTLFNGTVGNCFSGDMNGFLKSINHLMSFPQDTLIYSGHDYVNEAIAFTRTIDPDNPYLDAYLAKKDSYHVVSTIEDEFRVNPFVRYNDDSMIAILTNRNLLVGSESERWKSIFDLY